MRFHRRTGTVAGEIVTLEDVAVNAEEYRTKITGKGGVFEMMREKMPLFKSSRGRPEAGRALYMQQDGARVHTIDENLNEFARHGATKGFDIRTIT